MQKQLNSIPVVMATELELAHRGNPGFQLSRVTTWCNTSVGADAFFLSVRQPPNYFLECPLLSSSAGFNQDNFPRCLFAPRRI